MTPGLFAPLLLAGLGLLVAPWLIHRIRRPEREPTRFSSLMFVPNVRKEVIERRRIQHLLLMLMRMGLLALLAFAFARPFLEALAVSTADDPAESAHVILIDRSMSMAGQAKLEQARNRARTIVSGLRPQDRVAVIAFAEQPELMAHFDDPEDPQAGTAARARSAIDAVTQSLEAARYVPAMQEAERLLRSQAVVDDDQPGRRLVLHLITDFHRHGMPEDAAIWKLAPDIQLDPVSVGESVLANDAVQECVVRERSNGDIEIRASVRSWRESGEHETRVSLVVNGENVAENMLRLRAGNATQTVFSLPGPHTEPIAGYLELPDDDLVYDNRRYFAWRPAEPQRVDLFATANSIGGRLIELVLAPDQDVPWRLTRHDTDIPDSWRDNPSDVAIIPSLNTLPMGAVQALRDYIESGGSALVLVDPRSSDAQAAIEFLQSAGIAYLGPARSQEREGVFDLLAWVDFTHPVFVPMRGPRFNDFSSVRFHNYAHLEVAESGDARVIARFEADGDDPGPPAMIDAAIGDGHLMVWAFDLSLTTSTLPRNIRFVPFVVETVRLLSRELDTYNAYTVGDGIARPPLPALDWTVQLPGSNDPIDWNSGESNRRLTQPGLLEWRHADDTVSWPEAVNVPSGESNPERIPVSEFEIKLCSAPVLDRESPDSAIVPGHPGEEFVVHYEYGRWLVALMALLFLAESWYAARLAP